jgi:membrane protease YdiL (CAAX protease family)
MLEFSPNIIDHVLIFLIGVVLPLRSVKTQTMMKEMVFTPSLKKQLYFGNSLSLWILALVLVLANWLMGRAPIDFGFHWPPPELSRNAILSLIAFVLLYGADLVYETAFPKNREKTIQDWKKNIPFLPASITEFKPFIFLALTAGICEEFVFRGYFISYFYNLLGEEYAIAAVVIPTLLFALVHQYQGKKAMIKIFFMAFFFGLIYYYTGSLWQVMFLHFLVDLIGGFIAWRLLEPNEVIPEIEGSIEQEEDSHMEEP